MKIRDVCRPCHRKTLREPRISDLPDLLPGEEWRPIPGYEGAYSASTHGRIRSEPGDGRRVGPKRLTPAKGYFRVRLSLCNVGRTYLAHRLVALTFYGPCPDGQEVRHLDGNGCNNRIENLRYGTSSENKHDTVRHGNHRMRRLTHCKYGHEFTPENTEWTDGGMHRRCLTCRRAKNREWATRNRGASAVAR